MFHAANGNAATFANDAIHVNAQSTVIRNPKFDYSKTSAHGNPIGSFNSYVSVCDDEAFTLDGLDVHDGFGLRGIGAGKQFTPCRRHTPAIPTTATPWVGSSTSMATCNAPEMW